jgi:hypothetical protein
MPEPISSRIDRVKKTSTRIADNNAEENMDDALAELEGKYRKKEKMLETLFNSCVL